MTKLDEIRTAIEVRRLDVEQLSDLVAAIPPLTGDEVKELMKLTGRLGEAVDQLAATIVSNLKLEGTP